jgi:flavodoxin
MANILIVYYSSYGHIEAMAQAQAEGVRAFKASTSRESQAASHSPRLHSP